MSRTIRITALALAILAFFIFVGSPFQQEAQALVGVSTGLIAIIIAALAALGITLVTTASYNSLEDYVGSLLNDYANELGVSPSSLFNGVQTGTTKLGRIVVNNRFVLFLQAFASWIKAKFDLADNTTYPVVTPGTSLSDLAVYRLPLTIIAINERIIQFITVEGTGDVFCVFENNGNCKIISQASGIKCHTKYMYLDGRIISQYSFNLSNRLGDWNYYDNGYYGVPDSYIKYTPQQIDDALRNGVIDENNIGIDIVTGQIDLPFDNSDYDDGDGAIIDVGAEWGDSYPTVIDDVIPGAFSDGKEGEATIEYDSNDVVQEEVTDTPAEQISQNVSDYQSPGLQTVFPFCIPFDIYAFFECLAADPVAPSFTWRFYVPRICDEEFTVDLAPFNTVAQIVRTMELLAFIVGLALVTRDKFLRG